MKTPDGTIFGFGSTGNEAIWVKITVQAGAAALGTAESDACSPAPSSAVQVTLSVDNPDVSGACPHTFVFTAQLDPEQSGDGRLCAGGRRYRRQLDPRTHAGDGKTWKPARILWFTR